MSGLTLTVLGSAGTYPGPGRACSSYLIEAEGYRLLLDCGNGSLANLQQRVDVADIDALLLSHLHPDHFADLYGLHYALRFHPSGPQHLPVYAPAGAFDRIASLLSDDGRASLAEHCPFAAAAAGDELSLGPLRVTLFAANHPLETLAPRIAFDGRVLAYSGDSAPTPALDECARGADLFVCDATWLERDGPHPEGIHMTGAEAGRQAASAEAQRLLITHVLPTVDPADVAAEAAAGFGGEVLVARDLQEETL